MVLRYSNEAKLRLLLLPFLVLQAMNNALMASLMKSPKSSCSITTSLLSVLANANLTAAPVEEKSATAHLQNAASKLCFLLLKLSPTPLGWFPTSWNPMVLPAWLRFAAELWLLWTLAFLSPTPLLVFPSVSLRKKINTRSLPISWVMKIITATWILRSLVPVLVLPQSNLI